MRAFALAALAAGAACGAEGDFYPTPQDCPRFRQPQFVSRPLERAYPGIEYNIRPAIKGGAYPYTFDLTEAPEGMKIDARRGTDSTGKKTSQAFTLTVTKGGFYFVSPDGDDANPGTVDRPWKTVMRVAAPPDGFSYPAGAVVYFRKGVYAVSTPPKPGKKNANVVNIGLRSPEYWIAYPGEKPAIDFGWSEAKHKAAQAEQAAAGRGMGREKEGSAMGYGRRFAFTGKYLYMDGLEIKNTCYYGIVMWNGRKTVHIRRCDMHDLWADWAENPGFIFTYAGDRKGDFNAWGVRPRCGAYENFVIQDNRFHDRHYVRKGRGGHGGGFVWYTVHNAVIEDNDFRDIHRGEAICDKDNGFGNTYRGNTIRGEFSLLGQWNNDETEICHNYFEGRVRIGLQPGWVRNIWLHHNTIRGNVAFMGGATKRPDKLDESRGDYSNARTPDSTKLIREFPAGRKLVHFYRNVIDAPTDKIGDRKPGIIAAIPNNKGFADRWRYVRWDENLVDSEAKIELLWGRYTDFSLLKSCGFDKGGIRAPVALDAGGRLPAGSPYAGKYGRRVADSR